MIFVSWVIIFLSICSSSSHFEQFSLQMFWFFSKNLGLLLSGITSKFNSTRQKVKIASAMISIQFKVQSISFTSETNWKETILRLLFVNNAGWSHQRIAAQCINLKNNCIFAWNLRRSKLFLILFVLDELSSILLLVVQYVLS